MDLDDDESITLYPDRRPALLVSAAAVAALIAGAWLVVASGTAIGYAAIGVGGLALVGSAAWLSPSRAFLHLTDRGFIYSSAFNPRRVDWLDVRRFGIAKFDGGDRVGWDYAAHYPADVSRRAETKGRIGFEAILPRCCRMRSDRLVALLEERRQRPRPAGP